jgi:hypothetical protein
MRPDRILVGEVRRKRETETLFEAIHTGHSVYATFHANSAKEAEERLTNAPLDVPKIMLPAISLIIVQFRNRRSGKRRTFQIAEILPNGEVNVILQYDIKKDVLVRVSKSKALYDNISLFTGMSDSEITRELRDKIKVLNYLVKKNIDDVDGVGRIVAEYYTDKDNLMKYVSGDKDFPLASQLKLELPVKASNVSSNSQENAPNTLSTSNASNITELSNSVGSSAKSNKIEKSEAKEKIEKNKPAAVSIGAKNVKTELSETGPMNPAVNDSIFGSDAAKKDNSIDALITNSKDKPKDRPASNPISRSIFRRHKNK